MDQRIYEFYKAILIGSRVQRMVEGITELGKSSDISTEISDGVLRAELFVAEQAQQPVEPSMEILKEISKTVYSKVFSWAGEFRTENKIVCNPVGEHLPPSPWEIKPSIEKMLDIASQMLKDNNSNPEHILQILSMVYHSILYIQPFWDGNEKVARLFANYIALGYKMPMFDIAPNKEDKINYSNFISAIRNADKGNLTNLTAHFDNVIYNSKWIVGNTPLGPSARRMDEQI